jgi:hypothetical protein
MQLKKMIQNKIKQLAIKRIGTKVEDKIDSMDKIKVWQKKREKNKKTRKKSNRRSTIAPLTTCTGPP